MSLIKGATDELTIDPTSKAARVVLRDAAGEPVAQGTNGSYSVILRTLTITGTPSGGAIIFSLLNMNPERLMQFERIELFPFFNNGTGAASAMAWQLAKYYGIVNQNGQTIPIISNPRKTTDGPSAARAAVNLNGQTLTGSQPFAVDIGQPIGTVYQGRVQHGATQYMINQPLIFDYTGPYAHPLELAYQEALTIRVQTNIANGVAGDSLRGQIDWTELSI